MKKVTGYLQHPYIKIFAAPFAPIAFGLIVGIFTSSNYNLLQAILLYATIFFAHLIEHFQYQKYRVKNKKATPNSLLYGNILLLLIVSILFMLSQHWIINLLLILYLLFIVFQYVPFQMVGTIYHYFLNIFFNGFLLNTVAYFSQTNGITPNILQSFIPLVLFYAGSELIDSHLKGHLDIYRAFETIKKQVNKLSFFFMIIAMTVGVFMSLPSMSYFIVQIFFILIILPFSIPILVKVQNSYKVQKKINYNSAISLLFALLYTASFLL